MLPLIINQNSRVPEAKEINDVSQSAYRHTTFESYHNSKKLLIREEEFTTRDKMAHNPIDVRLDG
jgi:hypothetical protein